MKICIFIFTPVCYNSFKASRIQKLKIGSTSSFSSYKQLKLKLRVSLTGYTVTMVT